MKNLIYLMIAIITLSCNTDSEELLIANAKSNKPTKDIVLTPTILNNNEIGRIFNHPVDYFGELPNNFNGGIVDWNSDGTEDLVTLNNDKTVSINGIVVNYNSISIQNINGFIDVNNDGKLDVITLGGIPYCYDTTDIGTRTYWAEGISYVKGQRVYVNEGCCVPKVYVCQTTHVSDSTNSPNASSILWRFPYGVAYGIDDKYPLKTEDILTSMVVTEMSKNPERIKWDLSAYGYDCYTFYLWLGEAEPRSGDYVFGTTSAYGEFGYHISNVASNSNRIAPGTLLTFIMRKGWYTEQVVIDIQF